MGWRRWSGAPIAACVVLGLAGPGSAVELRRLELRSTPEGADASLVLSDPVRPVVRAVQDDAGRTSRLYLDLPRGARLASQVPRAFAAPAPLARVRIGQGEARQLRVVLDLEAGTRYHVRRLGRVITVALAADAPSPPPAVLPQGGPPAPAPLQPSLGRPRIVLDPGHGGHDPGARGYAVEKAVTLAISQHLARLLRERLQADVVLTRTGDVTLALAERTARANAEGADLFLSIHANASPHRSLRGIETYYLNDTNDRASIRLAAMENGLDLLTRARSRGRSDLRYILSNLVQVGKMEESIGLATAVQRGLVGQLSARYDGVADLGVKRGPFYVLVGAYMPCVLVETSFLTHPGEGRRLAGRAYQEVVAEGIYRGIESFLVNTRRARTL